ncbi:MAG: HAMP domain-containing histidine kinase [Erysipelotrichaceae bacterium]|nr:HAMP domain-containing histidine kinase [Erysipelotrichaceae bacterium]
MRKLFRSITDLSLVQQLTLIMFSLAFIILAFFSVYLRGNITDFVNNQTMNIVRTSQNTIVSRVESSSFGTSEIGADAQVSHFVFTRDVMSLQISASTFTPQFQEEVGKLAAELEESWSEGVTELLDSKYYYRSYRIDNNRVIVSIIDYAYGQNIENTLLTRVSNTTFFVVTILFILILFWTLSIITPLQQIRTYIDRVRKGEQATLKIERKDEIGELATELVSLQDELKRQEETKEEMIHNISHDLKTPIATIKSYAESIKDGIYPYDTLEKSVDVIVDNANRLEQKVYSLLFLNRLDYMMDQAKDTDKTTNMKETIEKVLLSLKMIRPEVTIDYDLQEAIFKGDDESWRVVIENLIDNALRYAETRIDIILKPNELSISNDGPCISEERMQKLFKPFEKGTKGKFGLGLSICSKVAHAYGYDIDAENLEKGVVFRISEKEKPKKEKRKGKNIDNTKKD